MWRGGSGMRDVDVFLTGFFLLFFFHFLSFFSLTCIGRSRFTILHISGWLARRYLDGWMDGWKFRSPCLDSGKGWREHLDTYLGNLTILFC